ncbi:hypothetical protein [Nocardioides sp. URHA0020]|uniref:hypothetical protein n=1 Tax=Nocardioides sp. URHA0020 TaxID=1380392 RepID=UPI0012DEAA81|nr:hypothetical protein [Nocardioides sp. URHA0020]
MAEAKGRDPLGLRAGGEGTITGTVVCAAAIAYSGGHTDSVAALSGVILGTVAVYWIAHLHAVTIGSALTHRHHPLAAFEHALGETWPIAGASVVPLAVLLAASLFGADLRTAAWIALGASIALLTAYSYLAGVRGGLDTWGRIASGLAGLGLGLLVVALKVALH